MFATFLPVIVCRLPLFPQFPRLPTRALQGPSKTARQSFVTLFTGGHSLDSTISRPLLIPRHPIGWLFHPDLSTSQHRTSLAGSSCVDLDLLAQRAERLALRLQGAPRVPTSVVRSPALDRDYPVVFHPLLLMINKKTQIHHDPLGRCGQHVPSSSGVVGRQSGTVLEWFT